MRRYEKLIREPEIIAAMLDTFDTVFLGMFDEGYPYVVPLSFGYEIKDNKLFAYVHSALKGHKLDLLEKNPNVCVSFGRFSSFPDRPYKKTYIHDYRSVMAFGKMSLIEKKDTANFKNSMRLMLKQYGREMTQMFPERIAIMNMYQIECDWDMVFGKSEMPVRSVEEVPFIDVYNTEDNGEPFDIADLLSKKFDDTWAKRKEGE